MIFSCRTRTSPSSTLCCPVYTGMLSFVTTHTITTIKGSEAISTDASLGSIVTVIRIPPVRRIGPRTPSRCILAIIRFTL